MGPLIVGTTVVAAGCFIPLNTGLECIHKSTPIVIQGGFISAFIYHFMVNDANGVHNVNSGVIGSIMAHIVGGYTESQVRAFIALLWILTYVGQVSCY